MNDPWVRGVCGSWIQSPQSEGVHSLCVPDLIAGGERVWNIDKIESLFSDDMVQAILDTPLFAEVQNDRIAWMMDSIYSSFTNIIYCIIHQLLSHHKSSSYDINFSSLINILYELIYKFYSFVNQYYILEYIFVICSIHYYIFLVSPYLNSPSL